MRTKVAHEITLYLLTLGIFISELHVLNLYDAKKIIPMSLTNILFLLRVLARLETHIQPHLHWKMAAQCHPGGLARDRVLSHLQQFQDRC